MIIRRTCAFLLLTALLTVASATQRSASSRTLDEDLPDRSRSGPEEVAAVIPPEVLTFE